MKYLGELSAFLLFIGLTVPLAAQEKQMLKYDLAEGEQVHYRVTIILDSPIEKHTMTGVISYTGLEKNSEQLSMKFQGGLKESKQAKGSSGIRGPRGFGRRPGGPPPGLFGRGGIAFNGLKETSTQLSIHPNGDVESLKAESQIPYLLGNLSLLPFEALADDSQASWQSGNGITVTQQNDSGFSRSPFRETTKVIKTGGSELTKYKIESVDGALVTIKKTYELNSPSAGQNDNGMKISGTGTFVFNKEVSMPESLSIKYDFEVQLKDSKITMPLAVAYERLSKEEIAEVRAKEEFVKNNPGINTDGTHWTEEVQQNIIKELQSTDVHVVQRRLVRLSARLPFLEEKKIAEALRPLLDKGGQTGKMAGMAWRRWKVIVPELNAEYLASLEKKKMEASVKPATENPFDPAEKPRPVAPQMRTWSDTTGQFKIEATFIELKGDSITLKRKDGKVISLPIAKLSEPDQKHIKEMAQPKAVNPFE
jgi:hypothetical protein